MTHNWVSGLVPILSKILAPLFGPTVSFDIDRVVSLHF